MRKIVWLLVVVSSFILGTAAMRYLGPQAAVVVDYKDVPKAKGQALDQIAGTTNATDEAQPVENVLDNTDRFQSIQDFDLSTPLGRAKQAVALAEMLTPENLEAVLAELDQLEGHDKFLALQLIVSEWGKFDPQGAFTYVQDSVGMRMTSWLGSAALSDWVQQDPLAAFAFAQQNSSGRQQQGLLAHMAASLNSVSAGIVMQIADTIDDPDVRQSLFRGAIRNLIDQDGGMREALNFYVALDPADRSDRALGMIARELTRQTGGMEALAWAAQVGDAGLQAQLQDRIAMQWARAEPAKAASWYSQTDEVQSLGLAREIAEQWGEHDPVAAVTWAMNLPEYSSQALGQAVSEWADQDPDAAAEWLNNQPSSTMLDPAVDSFARKAARLDPEGALDWALSITSESQRYNTIMDVAKYWASKDKEAATAWMNETTMSDADKAQVLAIEEGQRMRPPWAGR